MDYQITMLTVSQPIPTGSSGAARYTPWSNSSSTITFHDPVLSTITISDDDAMFESGYYSPGEGQQTLTSDTTFGFGSGAQTVPAGTQLGNFQASYIEDADGNRFVAMFPRTLQSGSIGTELGGHYSVLIFPEPQTDALTGETVYPEFDPNTDYHFDGLRLIGPDSGAGDDQSYPPQDSVPCFVSGTMIETMFGPRAIESLTEGDLIRTRDHGMRWLLWIGSTYFSPEHLDLQPNLRPIRIRANALAPGVPARNLTVSPQHRIFIRSTVAEALFGEAEILVAAKHLVGLPGIEGINPDQGVTYWHMLFDGHEVVMSNGAWSESLFTGPQAMEAVGPVARRQILSLFPQLTDPGFRPKGARRLLTGREGRRLARHHAAVERELVQDY